MTKYITVAIPDHVYEKLRKMRKNKEIVSVSGFVRHLIYLALGIYTPGQIGVRYVRRATVEEVYELRASAHMEIPEKVAIYGEHQKEIMNQLRKVIEERRKKLEEMGKEITQKQDLDQSL